MGAQVVFGIVGSLNRTMVCRKQEKSILTCPGFEFGQQDAFKCFAETSKLLRHAFVIGAIMMHKGVHKAPVGIHELGIVWARVQEIAQISQEVTLRSIAMQLAANVMHS